MNYFTFKADWQEVGDRIIELIDPFAKDNNFAVLYNTAPEWNDVYIATEDKRMILTLEDEFDLTELDDINYQRDLMFDSNRQWGVIGNPSLINF